MSGLSEEVFKSGNCSQEDFESPNVSADTLLSSFYKCYFWSLDQQKLNDINPHHVTGNFSEMEKWETCVGFFGDLKKKKKM